MTDRENEDVAESLEYIAENLRMVHGLLEGHGDTGAAIRLHVERALQHVPPAPAKPRELEGDFAEGTSIGGDDTLRKTQALEGEPVGGKPTDAELLAENARLQERIAQLEAQHNGNG